jgi:type III secretory pathway component EscS
MSLNLAPFKPDPQFVVRWLAVMVALFSVGGVLAADLDRFANRE